MPPILKAVRLGQEITGARTREEALDRHAIGWADRLKISYLINKDNPLVQKLSLLAKTIRDNYARIVDPVKTLEISSGEDYFLKFMGELYPIRGLMEKYTNAITEIYREANLALQNNLYNPAQLYRYLTAQPEDINELKLFNQIAKNPNHPLHFYEKFRQFGIEMHDKAVELGLLPQPTKYRGKYFPALSAEILFGEKNYGTSAELVRFATGGFKLFMDRWLPRLREEVGLDEATISRYPHLVFTYAMLQEIYDVFTRNFIKSVLLLENSNGFPNIAPHSLGRSENGELLPISQIYKLYNLYSDILSDMPTQREVMKRILKNPDVKNLPRDKKREYVAKEIEEYKALKDEIKAKKQFYGRQIALYRELISTLTSPLNGQAFENALFDLFKKYGYSDEEAEKFKQYYSANRDRFVVIDYSALKDPRLGIPLELRRKIVRVPTVQAYDLTAGLIVSNEMYENLVQYFEITSPSYSMELVKKLGDAVVKMTNTYKYLKVALNPPSHIKNIFGNFAFYYLAGVPPDKIPFYYMEGIRMLLNDNTRDLLYSYGIGVGSFSKEILTSIYKELKRDYELMQGKKGFQPLYNFLVKTFEIANKFGVIYDQIDKVARAGLIKYFNDSNKFGENFIRLDKDYNLEILNEDKFKMAMAKAYKYTIDYGAVSPLIKKIRSGLLGTFAGVSAFVTFNAKVPFVLGTALRENPFRAWSLMMLPFALFFGSWALLYKENPDEARLLWRSTIDAFKNHKVLVFPYKTKEGKYMFISLAGWHPLDNFYDALFNLSRGEFGRALVESGLVYSTPFSQVLTIILTGKDPFTEKEYFTDLDREIPERYFLKLLTVLSDALLMSYFTTYGYATLEAMGARDEIKIPKLFGISLRERSIEEFIKYHEAGFLRAKIDIGKLRGEYYRKYERGEIDSKKLDEFLKQLDEYWEKVEKKRTEFYNKLFE